MTHAKKIQLTVIIVLMVIVTGYLGYEAMMAHKEKEAIHVLEAFEQNMSEQDYDKIMMQFASPFFYNVDTEYMLFLNEQFSLLEDEIINLLLDEEARLVFLEGSPDYFVRQMDSLLALFKAKDYDLKEQVIKARIKDYVHDLYFFGILASDLECPYSGDNPNVKKIIGLLDLCSVEEEGFYLPREAIKVVFSEFGESNLKRLEDINYMKDRKCWSATFKLEFPPTL